jgi:hypothetical protein
MILSTILKRRSLLAQLPGFSFSNQLMRQSYQLHQQYSTSQTVYQLHGLSIKEDLNVAELKLEP